ncbi:hypothetical protein ETAA8_26940 [Anatilimnocola aggregata]|uniref:Uncharacterized protein n=1 Tax=Anatilimnocola aggregata TaxID=2528021 RepID=A0A517YBI3_9BACT|nr:hypothetical protein ETAA8_26940 [Anatilimnocola aggregata]
MKKRRRAPPSDQPIHGDRPLSQLKPSEHILMVPSDQLRFWQALNRPVTLSNKQRELAKLMERVSS